jgi:hypothetical protein
VNIGLSGTWTLSVAAGLDVVLVAEAPDSTSPLTGTIATSRRGPHGTRTLFTFVSLVAQDVVDPRRTVAGFTYWPAPLARVILEERGPPAPLDRSRKSLCCQCADSYNPSALTESKIVP